MRSQGARLVPVAMVDLDDFKAVNDVHGHATGDRVLAELGRRVQVAAGPHAFVARVGGDEFVAIFGSLQRQEAEAMAEHLRQAVASKPFAIVGGGIPALSLTPTVVLSELPAVDLSLEEILTVTHERLQHGKVHGKDQVLCTWEMGQPSPGAEPFPHAGQPLESVDTLGAPVILLGALEVIAYRLRFVARPQGGFIEDRQVNLARLSRSLSELTLTCVDSALAWGDGPPMPAIHMDLEMDVLEQGFAERLAARACPTRRTASASAFFVPAQFSEEQGERSSKVVQALRQSGFSFGVREAGGGGTSVENLMLLQPSWIRLSHALCSGVSQVKAKRERLQHWIGLLTALKTPLLADQVADKDLMTLEELGLLGAVQAKLSRELRF